MMAAVQYARLDQAGSDSSSTSAIASGSGSGNVRLASKVHDPDESASHRHPRVSWRGVSLLIPRAPPPPAVPSFLAPRHRDFNGYKLQQDPLPCREIKLGEKMQVGEKGSGAAAAASSSSSDASSASSAPPSFHSLSQQLHTNHMTLLQVNDESGSHEVYYVDRCGVWKVDLPEPASSAGSADSHSHSDSDSVDDAGGSSQLVHRFEREESMEGMSIKAVAPCFLLLTRAGGRLTIFQTFNSVDSSEKIGDEDELYILFDGSPLSPPPLSPCNATISAALLVESSAQLWVVLYEFFHVETEEGSCSGSDAKSKSCGHQAAAMHSSSRSKERAEPLQFGHETDALRTAGNIGVVSAKDSFSSIMSSRQPLHKLTALPFSLRNVRVTRDGPILAPPSKRNNPPHLAHDKLPRADFIHGLSSVQNCKLTKDQMPSQCAGDSSWCAPLACWLEPITSPQLASSRTHAPKPDSTDFCITPSHAPFHWYVVARVPYFNETESVIYDMARKEADKEIEQEAERQVTQRAQHEQAARKIHQEVNAGNDDEAKGASDVREQKTPTGAMPPTLPFTSDKLVSDTHNLKHYAIDDEDEEGMSEFGTIGSGWSHNPRPEVRLHLFDYMGNLLAVRGLGPDAFLFAQKVGNGRAHPSTQAHGSRGIGASSHVIAVKQHEELVLYGVSAAPQLTSQGLSLGAAGCVHPFVEERSADGDEDRLPSLPHTGIVLKPIFSFAGLGYVQSGKKYKKFFVEDGTHQYIIIAEFARLVYVYGRAEKDSPSAHHWLLQQPFTDEDDQQHILGMATTIQPIRIRASAIDHQTMDGRMTDNDNDEQHVGTASVQGQPLLYVLTAQTCRRYQLPPVTMPA